MTELVPLIQRAIARALDPIETDESAPIIDGSMTIADLEEHIVRADVDLVRVFAEGTLEALHSSEGFPNRNRRDGLKFLVADRRPPEALRFTVSDSTMTWSIAPETVARALVNSNRAMELLHDIALSNGVPLFSLLGMRNLSSFVGEVFKRELYRLDEERFLLNPHQDGYPDLLALTPEGSRYIRGCEERGQMSEKRFWSPYPHGGIEIKATCGNTPPARRMAKPGIGDPRIPLLVSAEWKAHHQSTNNLIGLYWDFVDGITTILAAFYRCDLTPQDWGGVIVPSAGSRTTSVSIMVRGRPGEERGVRKMGRGWVVLPEDSEMLARLSRVFSITSTEIDAVTTGTTAKETF